jgi:hypothetical protein
VRGARVAFGAGSSPIRLRPTQACDHRCITNLVAIYGPPGDSRVDEQLRLLSTATDAARERGVGYLEVRRMPQSAGFREIEQLEEHEFAVVLVRDGASIARWNEVVEPNDIWTTFDAD